MKAIGMPPSDPRIRQMNDAQWLWCYMNVLEDKEEDEKMWKTRLDYVGWYIDPERALSVMDEDDRKEDAELQKNGVYNSNEFDVEARAAALGYNPSSGLTPVQFLEQHSKSQYQEVDIMTADFDTLLASGEFVNVTNADNSVGNSRESESDFLSRVMGLKEFADDSYNNIEQQIANEDIEIGLDDEDMIPINEADILINDLLGDNREENNEINFDHNNIKNYDNQNDIEEEVQNFDNMSPEEFKKFLEEHGLTEDDLDIIETSDDE